MSAFRLIICVGVKERGGSSVQQGLLFLLLGNVLFFCLRPFFFRLRCLDMDLIETPHDAPIIFSN